MEKKNHVLWVINATVRMHLYTGSTCVNLGFLLINNLHKITLIQVSESMFLLVYSSGLQDDEVPYSEERNFPDPTEKALFHAVFSVLPSLSLFLSLFLKPCWSAVESIHELCSGPPLQLALALANIVLYHDFW